ncbi:MAG: hypothetical protein AAGE88_04105 [Actinomycetota bacterium]
MGRGRISVLMVVVTAVALGLVVWVVGGDGTDGGGDGSDGGGGADERRARVQAVQFEILAAAMGGELSEELIEGLAPETDTGALGGWWIDDDGRLVLGLVEGDAGLTAATAGVGERVEELVTEGRLGAADDVRIVEVVFGLDEIHAVNADFAARYLDDAAGPGGPAALSVSVNLKDNRADLYAEPDWMDDARGFADGYPDGLVTVIPVERGGLGTTADVGAEPAG